MYFLPYTRGNEGYILVYPVNGTQEARRTEIRAEPEPAGGLSLLVQVSYRRAGNNNNSNGSLWELS